MSEESVVTTLGVAGVRGTHGLPWRRRDLEIAGNLLHALELCRYLEREPKSSLPLCLSLSLSLYLYARGGGQREVQGSSHVFSNFERRFEERESAYHSSGVLERVVH